VVHTKLAEGVWELVNTTTFPHAHVSIAQDVTGKTLYSLGLWPSAHLMVRVVKLGE
jgi:hypothetical protein